MKLRKLVYTLVTIAFAAAPAMAQHPGFRIGIAPAFNPAIAAGTVNPPLVIPGFSQPMVVPFTTAQSTFGFPAVGMPAYGFPTYGIPAYGFPAYGFPAYGFPAYGFPAYGVPAYGVPAYGVPAYGVPPVQAPLIVTRPEFHHRNGFVGAPGAPGQIIVPGAVFTNAPQSRFGPPSTPVVAAAPAAPFVPQVGMPRTEVLRQFGQPSATVITRTGETLYFPGGVTVIIQNGQVAGPR